MVDSAPLPAKGDREGREPGWWPEFSADTGHILLLSRPPPLHGLQVPTIQEGTAPHCGGVPIPAAGLESGQIVPHLHPSPEESPMRLGSLWDKGGQILRSREIAQQLKYVPSFVGC